MSFLLERHVAPTYLSLAGPELISRGSVVLTRGVLLLRTVTYTRMQEDAKREEGLCLFSTTLA